MLDQNNEPILVVFTNGSRYDAVYERLRAGQLDNLVAEMFPKDVRLAKTNAVRLWLDLTLNYQHALAAKIQEQIVAVYAGVLTRNNQSINVIWLENLHEVAKQYMARDSENWKAKIWTYLAGTVG